MYFSFLSFMTLIHFAEPLVETLFFKKKFISIQQKFEKELCKEAQDFVVSLGDHQQDSSPKLNLKGAKFDMMEETSKEIWGLKVVQL